MAIEASSYSKDLLESLLRLPGLLILRKCIWTGFSRTATLILLQTSGLVGRCAIFSTISISSGRTKPKTVYAFRHSLWLAKLIKNSGPEPTHAIEPLFMVGHASVGISLNIVPWASSVPWTSANGGPNEAYKVHEILLNQTFKDLQNIKCMQLLIKLTYVWHKRLKLFASRFSNCTNQNQKQKYIQKNRN